MNITDVKTDSLQHMPLTNMPLPKTALLKPNLEAIVFNASFREVIQFKLVNMEITIRNHSDLNIKIDNDKNVLVNELFYIPNYKLWRYINIYHLENHPKIICYEMIDSICNRFFFTFDDQAPTEYHIKNMTRLAISMKPDLDNIIHKISNIGYEKKRRIIPFLLILEDNKSYFSQNNIPKDIMTSIAMKLAELYVLNIEAQFKILDEYDGVIRREATLKQIEALKA